MTKFVFMAEIKDNLRNNLSTLNADFYGLNSDFLDSTSHLKNTSNLGIFPEQAILLLSTNLASKRLQINTDLHHEIEFFR